MTTPNPFTRGALPGTLSAPRSLAAWGLLGYVALFLLFEFLQLTLPGGRSLSGRAAAADFRSILILALPVLAVLLTGYLSPALPGTRLVATVAVVEYGAALTFGLLTLLIGLPAVLGGVDSVQGGLGALRYLTMGAAELVLTVIAGYVALRALTRTRHV